MPFFRTIQLTRKRHILAKGFPRASDSPSSPGCNCQETQCTNKMSCGFMRQPQVASGHNSMKRKQKQKDWGLYPASLSWLLQGKVSLCFQQLCPLTSDAPSTISQLFTEKPGRHALQLIPYEIILGKRIARQQREIAVIK